MCRPKPNGFPNPTNLIYTSAPRPFPAGPFCWGCINRKDASCVEGFALPTNRKDASCVGGFALPINRRVTAKTQVAWEALR